MRRCKWSDNEVKQWAEIYITGPRILDLEKEIGIPHATLSWCFINNK